MNDVDGGGESLPGTGSVSYDIPSSLLIGAMTRGKLDNDESPGNGGKVPKPSCLGEVTDPLCLGLIMISIDTRCLLAS